MMPLSAYPILLDSKTSFCLTGKLAAFAAVGVWLYFVVVVLMWVWLAVWSAILYS